MGVMAIELVEGIRVVSRCAAKNVGCERGKFVTFQWKKCRKDVALTEWFRTNTSQ